MSLQKKIADWFGTKEHPGDIGIEIEAEFEKGTDLDSRYIKTKNWVTTRDNSLRNGLEYISNGPVKHEKLKEAVDEFAKLSKDYEFLDSIRCSVHYHINMQRCTWEEVYRVATAYWLIENLLVEPHGSDRKGNLHCLRLKDADALLFSAVDGLGFLRGDPKFKKFGSSMMMLSDNSRYSALNLSALKKYGSIEFRFCRGTTDPEEIFFWGDLLCMLVHSAKRISISELVNLAGKGRSEKSELLGKLLGPTRRQELLDRLGPVNWEHMIEENVPYGLSLLRAFNKEEPGEGKNPVRPFIISTKSEDLETDDFFYIDDKKFVTKARKVVKKGERAFVQEPFENAEPKLKPKMSIPNPFKINSKAKTLGSYTLDDMVQLDTTFSLPSAEEEHTPASEFS